MKNDIHYINLFKIFGSKLILKADAQKLYELLEPNFDKEEIFIDFKDISDIDESFIVSSIGKFTRLFPSRKRVIIAMNCSIIWKTIIRKIIKENLKASKKV